MKVNVLSRLKIVSAVQVKQVKGSDYPAEANAFVKKLMKLVNNGTIEISSNEVDHADVPVVRYTTDSGKSVEFFMESYDGKWYTFEDMNKPCDPKKVIEKLLSKNLPKAKTPASGGLPEVSEKERLDLYNSLDTRTKKAVDSSIDYLKKAGETVFNSLFADDWLQHSIFGSNIRTKGFKENFKTCVLCIAPFFNKLFDKKIHTKLFKEDLEKYSKSSNFPFDSVEEWLEEDYNGAKSIDQVAERRADYRIDHLRKIQKYLEKRM